MESNWPVPQIINGRCHGCGLCVKACPYGVLALQDGKAVVRRAPACRYDGCCEKICPEQAIYRPYCLLSSLT